MQHHFTTPDGVCLRCGAAAADVLLGDVGCRTEVNDDGYAGLGRSRTEQGAGITAEHKAAYLLQGDDGIEADIWLERVAAYNRRVREDVETLAADAARAAAEHPLRPPRRFAPRRPAD